MATERIDIVITETGSRTVVVNMNDMARSADNSRSAIDRLNGTLRGLAGAFAVNEIRKAADEYTTMQNRLKALGVAQSDLATTTERLVQISNRSYSSLEGTTTLYARLLPAVRDLGASQNELFTFTQAASQAMTVFGTSGGTATGALLQLSQAMSRGKVQAQEFRSLQDGMYPLLQVVAKNIDGLGGSVAKLRERMLDGKLTSHEFFQAAIKGAPELELAMLKIAPTTTQVMTVLQNQFTLAVGKMNEMTGATQMFADAMIGLAPYLPQIVVGVVSLAAALGSLAVIKGAVTGLQSLTTLIMANPFTALAVAVAAAAVAIYTYRDAIKVGIDETTSLGDVTRVVLEDISNLWALFSADRVAQAQSATEQVKAFDQSWVLDTANFIDMIGGAFRALGVGIITVFTGIGPQIQDVFTSIINFIMEKINALTSKLVGEVNSIFSQLGMDTRLTAPQLEIDTSKNYDYFKTIGAESSKAFAEGVGATDYAKGVLSIAQRAGASRVAAGNTGAVSNFDAKAEGSAMGAPVDKKALAAAEREAKKFATELEKLRDKYDGVYKAQSEMKRGTEVFDRALKEGTITLEQRNAYIAQMNQELRDAADPIGAINRELDNQTKLLGMTSDEQERFNQVKKITDELIKKGISQAQIEAAGFENKIKLIQQETEVSKARNAILEQTIGKEQELAAKRAAYAQLEAGTPAEKLAAERAYLNENSDLLETETQTKLRHIQERREQINLDLKGKVIDEKTHNKMMTQLDKQVTDIRLGQASDFFGGLSGLMQSHNKKAFAVGKAAAIAQATIATYQSATSAFSAMAGIPYVGPILGAVAAAAAIAAGMANIAQIKSQQMPAFAHGGSMVVGGVGGTDSQTVAFRATPGETVRVTTPSQESAAQARSGGGGDVYNFSMPGITNATQARKSASQVQRSVVSTVSTGKRFR